jgi:hypothetical protein
LTALAFQDSTTFTPPVFPSCKALCSHFRRKKPILPRQAGLSTPSMTHFFSLIFFAQLLQVSSFTSMDQPRGLMYRPAFKRNPAGRTSRSPAAPSSCALPFCRSCPLPSDLMFCGAVSNPDAASASDDSDSESSFVVSNISSKQQTKTGIRAKLLQFSNYASMLCVLDCTVLPIVTIILPLFGIVAGSPAQMEWLHQAGHQIALGFVLPVGLMATISNFVYSHKTLWIACLGWLGLVFVVGANAGCSLVPHGVGGAVGHVVHEALHYLHHGIAHRVANLTGCGLLLFSNWLSHRKAHAMGTCSHAH